MVVVWRCGGVWCVVLYWWWCCGGSSDGDGILVRVRVPLGSLTGDSNLTMKTFFDKIHHVFLFDPRGAGDRAKS